MNEPRNDGRPTVLIFRSRLLEWSETFIAAQANALERYRPVYAGYRIVPAGAAYMGDAEVVPLEERAISRAFSEGVLKLTGHAPIRWMRALRRTNPSLLHAHFGFSARVPVRLARRLDLPLVITYHGADITIARMRRVDRTDRELAFAEASRIIAVSEFIATRLRAAGAPADRVVVHYIGVDTDRFRPGAAEREADTILFVGRLVAKKGLAHLLGAMPKIQAAVPAAKLLVVGDGPLRPRLETAARGLNVRFLGVRTPAQVAELMRRCAVMCAPFVVAPSGNAEGLGMTTVEAQASGLPVVASPSGGSTEAIVDGRTGFVVPATPDALAAKLIQLLQDPALRQTMGTAARAHVLERFDLRQQSRRLEQIYDDARRDAGPGASARTAS